MNVEERVLRRFLAATSPELSLIRSYAGDIASDLNALQHPVSAKRFHADDLAKFEELEGKAEKIRAAVLKLMR